MNRQDVYSFGNSLNLTNITIDERTAINDETFFIIKDNDNNQAYFCFQNKLKEGWQDLIGNKENIKEVEIEYIEHERGNKVINLYASKEEEFLI